MIRVLVIVFIFFQFSLIVKIYLCGDSEEDTISEQDPNQSKNPNNPNIPPSNGNTRNTLPTIPRLIKPENLSACTIVGQPFEFRSTDQDEDTVEYFIEIAHDIQFTNIYKTEHTTDVTRLYDLEKGQTYYWHVKASDGKATTAFSETFALYTEGDGEQNFVPFVNNILPQNNTTLPTVFTPNVNLSWVGNDILGDINDLKYYIYFGSDNGEQPPLIKENLNKSNLSVEIDSQASKKHIWSINVKDANGAVNRGVLRRFRLVD